jgi:phage shock protein A
MGIFTRARDIISANINCMLDRAEDPEKLVGLMVREMEDTLIELKASCAGAMATRRKIDHEQESVQRKAAEWQSKAQLAVQKGRDDLAREALGERKRYLDRAAVVEKEKANCEALLEQYQSDIAQLESKLDTVRERQRVLVERHIHALHKRRAQLDIRRADASAAMARFEHFEESIERMEADADLVNFGRKPTLSQQIDALDNDGDIEQELQRLKRGAAR